MRQSGFTLVEMVVVITIIAILLVLSAVGLAEVLATARDVRTVTLIRILHEACEAYRLEDPGRNYPGPGGDNGADSTKVIHRLLGSPRSVARQINILAQEPALVSFHRNWLEGPPPNTDPGASGVRIVDVRQNPAPVPCFGVRAPHRHDPVAPSGRMRHAPLGGSGRGLRSCGRDGRHRKLGAARDDILRRGTAGSWWLLGGVAFLLLATSVAAVPWCQHRTTSLDAGGLMVSTAIASAKTDSSRTRRPCFLLFWNDPVSGEGRMQLRWGLEPDGPDSLGPPIALPIGLSFSRHPDWLKISSVIEFPATIRTVEPDDFESKENTGTPDGDIVIQVIGHSAYLLMDFDGRVVTSRIERER